MVTLIDIILENNLFKGDHTNGTDKEFLHRYVSNFYQDHFAQLQFTAIKLLEVGTCTGASLKMWRKFFVNGKIEGVDINDYRMKEYIEDNITYYHDNAYDINFLNKLSNDYDIIIDDGPHTLDSQLSFIDLYYNKVKQGGFLIVEDIYCDNAGIIYNKFKERFNKDPQVVNKISDTGHKDEIIIWIQK